MQTICTSLQTDNHTNSGGNKTTRLKSKTREGKTKTAVDKADFQDTPLPTKA